ncbi:MAG TPA: biotin-dependent carboxyltransferase family protein [Intrasporangium sp.]|uniref:5-oxoprolinase subunit C family protein n=1 Tax=Intrasporangium sp. TaxID=1925024 RepID=UPI002D768738|nr:biotin-dependent carboxyltransferase family protein [Intrasporangium sp.]HET7399122.1 biotin-dependent carboxyltransferase family protein [Intrasporangium sp.]
MSIEVISPGLGCSVQDRGRPGYYNVGIPPSGALDLTSALAANLLVGNDADAPVIEAAYLGPQLRFTDAAVIALTGARLEPRLNGDVVPQWESLQVSAGDELSFGYLQDGARIYIAVGGGIDVPAVLGSRSTYTVGGFGGHQGRTLQAGDVLSHGTGGTPAKVLPEHLRPTLSREVDVRVVLGLYDYRLTPTGLDRFLDSSWTLSPVADRMGLRYSGPELEWEEREQPFGAGSDPSNIVDAGYPIGSIQVPGGVEPIILHRDAVSGGGYAMVATVISADLDLVAQCSPGTKTRFRAVSLEDAVAARQVARDHEENLRSALR